MKVFTGFGMVEESVGVKYQVLVYAILGKFFKVVLSAKLNKLPSKHCYKRLFTSTGTLTGLGMIFTALVLVKLSVQPYDGEATNIT